MKKPIVGIVLLMASFLSAQTFKSERITIPVHNYALYPSTVEMKTYGAEIVEDGESILPFSKEELKEKLRFEEFALFEAETGAPDLFFVINGVGVDDVSVKVFNDDDIYLKLYPTKNTVIKVIFMANGVNTHLMEFPVVAKVNAQKQPIPETFEVRKSEIEKYLVYNDEGEYEGPTSFLIEEYLKRALGKDFLEKDLIPRLQNRYDNRVALRSEKFYYIKDKKDDSVEEMTLGKLKELELKSADLDSRAAIVANMEVLENYSSYWDAQLKKLDLDSKDGTKLGWAILQNLYNISLIKGDIVSAEAYVGQMENLGYKKWDTSLLRTEFDKIKKNFSNNYSLKNGMERNYADSYPVDRELILFANQKLLAKNNIKDVIGHVITKDGEKLEGKISMVFSSKPSENTGNIISLDGDNTGKKVYVKYVNEKGNSKLKTLKCKDVLEISVGDRLFEPVNPKQDALESAANALSFSMNNTVFMEKMYGSDRVKLFKDLTQVGVFYYDFPEEKKAFKVSDSNFNKMGAEIFNSCANLSQEIGNGAYEMGIDQLIKIGEKFSTECN